MAADFHLRPDDPLPIYAQLERAIKGAVATGGWPIGRRLPTVREMAVDLKINANTVAKVYSELERQGVLSSRRGVGTFVAALPQAAATLTRSQRVGELRALAERFLTDVAAQGFTYDEVIDQLHRIASQRKENPHGGRH